MARLPNTSPQTLRVLQALLEEPAAWRYGYALSRWTGLASGTLYPLLMRLAEQGWLETRWVEPDRRGQPPRHTYRLTSEGARAAASQLADAEAKRGQAVQRPRPSIEGAGA
jgi:DNA-binding PadR family transcriptional regulator